MINHPNRGRLARGDAPDDEQLAETLKAWRAAAGINTQRAGELLGIPARTVEYVEAGRGFRYPKLLAIALQRHGQSDD